jgi:hypothetical protein
MTRVAGQDVKLDFEFAPPAVLSLSLRSERVSLCSGVQCLAHYVKAIHCVERTGLVRFTGWESSVRAAGLSFLRYSNHISRNICLCLSFTFEWGVSTGPCVYTFPCVIYFPQFFTLNPGAKIFKNCKRTEIEK